jgi:prepilin-type N-terminal cleavage/methylation domain-containing protein
MKMKKLKKGEKGFTLIELLIAILLTGIVASAITGTILYVLNVNFSTANRMAAVRQVRNVGFWISPDFQMARDVVPENNPATPELLTLTWIDWATNDTHEVIYTLENMPSGEFKRLQRNHYIESVLDSITIVAEYIDLAQTRIDPGTPCSFPTCSAFKFTVTANVAGQNETREYEVETRPGSQ